MGYTFTFYTRVLNTWPQPLYLQTTLRARCAGNYTGIYIYSFFKKRLGHCTGEIANSESRVSTVRSMSHVRFIARDFVAPERDFIAQSRIEEHTVLFRNQRVARPRNTGASP